MSSAYSVVHGVVYTVQYQVANDVFTHGQLYVTASRVGYPDNIRFLVPRVSITNVVYTEVLNALFQSNSKGMMYHIK